MAEADLTAKEKSQNLPFIYAISLLGASLYCAGIVINIIEDGIVIG